MKKTKHISALKKASLHKTISQNEQEVQLSSFRDCKPAPGDEFNEKDLDGLNKIYRETPLKK